MKVVIGTQTNQYIAFVGPYGVGKTTALRAISDIPVVSTEAYTAGEYLPVFNPEKTTTTVGFDYGEWQFPDGARAALVGVPGQKRFDAMWDAFLPQSSAVVLWLYGNSADALNDCRFWLKALADRNAISRFVVALTRIGSDVPESVLEPFRQEIRCYHPFAPLITADPRDPVSVLQSVIIALSTPFAVSKSE